MVVAGPVRDQRLRALIDTGSSATIFDSAVAEIVGIRLNTGEVQPERIHLLGQPRLAERHMVSLTLPPFTDITWETEVLFLREELTGLTFAGLLGTEGFLNKWVVSFNYYDGYFVVEERDAFVERLPKDPAEEWQHAYDSEWSPPR